MEAITTGDHLQMFQTCLHKRTEDQELCGLTAKVHVGMGNVNRSKVRGVQGQFI